MTPTSFSLVVAALLLALCLAAWRPPRGRWLLARKWPPACCYIFKERPRWEVGLAVQPGRWALCIILSFYRHDRGIAAYIGPVYLYFLCGAVHG